MLPFIMELQYWQSLPEVLLFTFFLLLVIMLITTRKPATGDAPKRPLPPGPKPMPIIGCIHHLLTGLPHRRLRDLARQYGPLMHLKLGQVSVVVVSSAQVATEVMKTHDLVFASRPEILAAKVIGYGCTDVVFAPYGEYWRQLRKICVVELLSARRVQSFRRVREEEVEGLVQSIAGTGGRHHRGDHDQVVNLTEKLYALTSSIASRAAFGKKSLRHERFLAAMKEAVKLASGFNIADLFPSLELVNVISGMKFRLEKVRRRLDGILDEIVEDHKIRKKISGDVEEEDLLDVLLRIQESGDHDAFSLTTDNIKAVIMDMFGAGTDTSATTMVWAMAELVRNPRVMRKVQAEVREAIHRSRKGDSAAAAAAAGELSNIIQDMPYLRMVIQETLRLHPPLPLLVPRLCRQRCEVGGFEIPANARVLVNAWAIARDPAGCWQPVDPEEFDPDRFRDMNPGFGGFFTGGAGGGSSSSMEYIPFGAGRRMCPGMQFAMATMELALARLLYCFNWEIPASGGMIKPDQELDMAEDFGATVTRKADLCLLASPYVPSSSSSPSATL